jgi:hypothetical protein
MYSTAHYCFNCNTRTVKLGLHLFDLLWIAVQQVVQQIHNKSTTFRQIHNFTASRIQLVVRQIHNKSNKWSLSFRPAVGHRNTDADIVSSIRYVVVHIC